MSRIFSRLKKLLNFPFSYLLVKSFFLYNVKRIRRAVWLPEFVKVKNSNIVLKRSSTPKIADLHFLGWSAINEYFSWNILTKLASRSSIIFDVGADIGLVSLYIAESNPTARIFAFEPSKHSYPILLETLKKNNSSTITPMKMALGATNSSSTFYYSPGDSVRSSLSQRVGFIADQINIQTIERFCVENKIEQVDLIKIDVEGFESDVIAGCGNKISAARPIILAEVLNESNGIKIAPVLPENYTFFRIIEEKKMLKEDIKIDRTSKHSNNYLFMPKEKISLLHQLSLI